MRDSRVEEAARILVDYSTAVKQGEYVQIITDPLAKPLALEVYKRCIQKGAYPVLKISLPGAAEIFYKFASEEQLKNFPDVTWYEIKKTDVVIYIGAPDNTRELSSIDPKKMSLRQKSLRKIFDWRVEKTRWTIYYYPTNSFAQEADMSLSEFEDFVFGATNVDWEKEAKKQDKIKKVLDKGKQVRIIGEDTDLTFSISGRQGQKCEGKFNMPDGEVYLAPCEKTTEGTVAYSFPAIMSGKEVDGIKLWFKKGKVVRATATKNEEFLKTMIKTDKGASYLGEFGIGCNFHIQKFVKKSDGSLMAKLALDNHVNFFIDHLNIKLGTD